MFNFPLQDQIDYPRVQDDSGLNGIKMGCCNWNDPGSSGTVTVQDGLSHSVWQSTKACQTGYYACGLEVRFKPYAGWGYVDANDDTAANGIKMTCCKSKHYFET